MRGLFVNYGGAARSEVQGGGPPRVCGGRHARATLARQHQIEARTAGRREEVSTYRA